MPIKSTPLASPTTSFSPTLEHERPISTLLKVLALPRQRQRVDLTSSE